jgi:DNA processing protein
MQQLFYQIALTMVDGIGDALGRRLIEAFGDAESVFKAKPSDMQRVVGIGNVLVSNLHNANILKRAEKELEFVEKKHINCYFISDPEYPYRLKRDECKDAPLLLYMKGNANLCAERIVSVVGTRNMTDYGKELTEHFVSELAQTFPDVLIVSGLAYGVDIQAHKSALNNKLPTVAVLAHGLDRIYPSIHRQTAVDMIPNGGVLTDFPSETNPDKPNFIKRNRIIAGISDATVIIESANKGGALITADIAESYGRDVFAFPGRVNDQRSQGCNRIIKQNRAALITNAEDFISAMMWAIDQTPKSVQTKLVFTDDETEALLQIFSKRREVSLNDLSAETGISISLLTELLFNLEIDGVIEVKAGNTYRLK